MNFRTDIQALRGLAVLLVIFYHANIGNLSGGYLGVDIFFVISGFLITNQIAKQRLNNSFSFKTFYLRRAWRLLPAVYAVLITSCIAAPFFLTTKELQDFTLQVIGTTTFTANFVLWLQTGYFETAAELKPLLHMWSLSIEEQYYLVIPALLFFVNAKRWMLLVCSLTFLSLLLMVVMNGSAPGAVFYLTPTRVWELGIGSILAISLINKKTFPSEIYGYLALFLIIGLSIQPINTIQYTIINNALITFATAVLLSSRLQLLNSNFILKTLAPIGTISYSLYLVHWPIMAFLNSASIKASGPNIGWRLAALLASFILATILYFLVEKKWRITKDNESKNNNSILPLIIIPFFLVLCAWSIERYRESIDMLPERIKNYGLSPACQNESSLFNGLCKTRNSPSMFVWGDSFSMHLAPALQASPNASFQQANRSSCSPLLKTAHFNSKKPNINASIECLKFNQSVFNYILQSKEIETVILASSWHYLLHDRIVLAHVDDSFKLQKKQKSTIINELIKLITLLKSEGKKVVVVAPPPSSGFDSRKCHERNTLNLIKIGGSLDCTLRFDYVLKHRTTVDQLMNTLFENKVATYNFTNKLCDSKTCKTTLNGTLLYNDTGHLSVIGSREYGRVFKLYEELLSLNN